MNLVLDRCLRANEPEMIAWHNLNVSRAERVTRAILLNGILCALLLTVFSGTSIVDSLNAANNSMPKWFSASVGAYIPLLVTVLTTWVIVPWLIQTVEDQSGVAHAHAHAHGGGPIRRWEASYAIP